MEYPVGPARLVRRWVTCGPSGVPAMLDKTEHVLLSESSQFLTFDLTKERPFRECA
jgi:hypothetical protein